MRVTHVKHSKKPLVCSKCGAKIKPSRNEKKRVTNKRTGKTKWQIVRVLGDSYAWIKFRHSPKRVRCSKSECRFRNSDLTQSDKLSRLYAAVEQADDAAAGWDGESGTTDDLQQVLQDLADEVREVAQEYTDSADNIEQAFTGGSTTADECREKAESLESYAGELEGTSFEDWEAEESDEEEDVVIPRLAFEAHQAKIRSNDKQSNMVASPWEQANQPGWYKFMDAVDLAVFQKRNHDAAKDGFIALMKHIGYKKGEVKTPWSKKWEKTPWQERDAWQAAVDAILVARNKERDEPTNTNGETREEWEENQKQLAIDAIGECPL